MAEYLKKIGKGIWNTLSGVYNSTSRAQQESKLAAAKAKAELFYKAAKKDALRGDELAASMTIKGLEEHIAGCDDQEKEILEQTYTKNKLSNCYLRSVFWNGINIAGSVAAEQNEFNPEDIGGAVARVCAEYEMRGKNLDPERFTKFIAKYLAKKTYDVLKLIEGKSGVHEQNVGDVERFGKIALSCADHIGADEDTIKILKQEINGTWTACYAKTIGIIHNSILANDKLEHLEYLEYWMETANESIKQRGIDLYFRIGQDLRQYVLRKRKEQEQTEARSPVEEAPKPIIPVPEPKNGNGRFAKKDKQRKNRGLRPTKGQKPNNRNFTGRGFRK